MKFWDAPGTNYDIKFWAVKNKMSFFKKLLISIFILAFSSALLAKGTVYRVGPDDKYKKPSELVKRVKSGDIIEIMPGTYLNDDAVWRTDNLTIRGSGVRPKLMFDEQGVIRNRKAIWVIAGDNILIENIEFSGAHVPNLNGVGLRVEGKNLTVRNSYFHHNEFAILTGSIEGTLTVKNSEFAYHHRKARFAHAVYVGDVEHFIFQGNYVHHSDGGHHIKSRARKSEILYNRLSDEDHGNSSYLIDLPNCGNAVIMGNILFQGYATENHTAIAYGAEGCEDKQVSLSVVNNSFLNQNPQGGFFVKNWTTKSILITNNIVVGKGKLAAGTAQTITNLVKPNIDVYDSDIPEFNTNIDPQAVNAGTKLNITLRPVFEYRHPMSIAPRRTQGKVDIGVFEFQE
jgi:hypothetical protein